ncbi:unnamed protein product [Caenorhabditis bovis]|uniref:Uncharacterized protein n=1 Tax=Caenorhabditis bovis TaxID=2654633 RepID=A0A8S1EIZ6_9PELO|nr:unnamed protein product [Caenorhabditis bovis]
MAYCAKPEKFFPVLNDLALQPGTLKGKVALVTGGGTGLGKAIATTFAHLGAKVAIAARRLDILEKTAAEIRRTTGGICEPFQLDVKDPTKVAKVFDDIKAKFNATPDILINNAAGNFIMATERLSPNAYGTIIDIVLKGTLHVTTELVRRCIKEGKGASVLSISTAYAGHGAPFVVPSAVSKSGVETMTKSLASEWAKYGMRFNAVAPGPIQTEGAFGRLFVSGVGDATEQASRGMNGAIIYFDGGQQHMNHGSGMGSFLHEWDHKKWEEAENVIRGRTGKSKSKI